MTEPEFEIIRHHVHSPETGRIDSVEVRQVAARPKPPAPGEGRRLLRDLAILLALLFAGLWVMELFGLR